MTDGEPRPGSEGYWSDLAEAESGPETVLDRIRDHLDGATIHGLTVTARRGDTVYAVVSQSKRQRGGQVVDLRTVVIDLGADTVKVSNNGLWVPRDREALDGLTRSVARTTSDVVSGEDRDPLLASIGDVDVEELLATELPPEDYEPEDDDEDADLSPAKGEPPAEAAILDERLAEAGVGTDERYIRLEFGAKAPWSHTRGDLDYLVENYGVYATSDDGLVLVDVDEPGHLDAALPETFRVSSPHGGDERAHHYFAVDDLDAVREALGTYNHSPSWGDVRTANQYVVGPGSQLDGCEKDGCDRCAEPDGGVYELVDDREIAAISAEWLVELLASDPAIEAAPVDGDAGDLGPAPSVADDEDDVEEVFDGEERGRIKHHAEHGKLDSLLRITKKAGGSWGTANFDEVGIETPEDFVAHREEHGDFTDVHGIGPATSERLERAAGLAAEAAGADVVECHRCDQDVAEPEAVVVASDGERTVWACRGGCS